MAEMMSEGHYRAVLENPKIAISAKKGTPCVQATVRIVEDGPHKGKRLPWEGWLTDSAGERTIRSLAYAGCTFPEDPETGEPNLKDFTGCGSNEVDAQISIETYTPDPTESNPNPKESKRPRVEFINPIGLSYATKDIDDDQQKMIARNFGGLITKVRKDQSDRKSKSGDTSFDPNELEKASPNGEKRKLY